MFYRHCWKVIFTLNFIYLDFCPSLKCSLLLSQKLNSLLRQPFPHVVGVSAAALGEMKSTIILMFLYHSHINRSTAQLQPYCSQKRKLINNTTSKTNSQGGYFILFPYSSRAHVWSYHWLCRAITCLSASHVRRLVCSKISRQDWDNHPSCLLRLGYFEFVLEDNTCFRKFRSRDVKGIPLALLL